MDPLSVTASVAGLFALTVQLINAAESIVRSVKTQPAILLSITQELTALQLVLERLEKSIRARQTPSPDDEALILVLDGCKEAYHNIGKELALLESNLKKNQALKLYTKMTFTSKLKNLSPMRDQLEKYKATLIIALHLRTLDTSPEDLLKEISNLRVDVNSLNSIPAPNKTRLGAIQQYLMATTNIVGRKTIDQADPSLESPETSSNRNFNPPTRSSSTTLVPQPSNTSDVQSTSSKGTNLETFSSFQDWLGTFAQDDEARSNTNIKANLAALRLASPELQSNTKSSPLESSSLPVDRSTEPVIVSQIPDEILVTVTIMDKIDQSSPKIEEISIKASAQVYDLIEKLHSRGYEDICGFKVDESISVGPITPFDAAWPIVVTSAASIYNFKDGLRINQDESLAEFYDNVLTADQLTHEPRFAFGVERNIHGLVIEDYWLNQNVAKLPQLTITFDRTIRIPEDGQNYHLPAILGTLPVLTSDNYRHKLPGIMSQKGGVLVPLYQREALVISFHENDDEESDDMPHHAIKVLAGSVNAISGDLPSIPGQSSTQDYIIVPPQQRLDGFCSEKGLVKQFVAMPIGSNYTAESQLTGGEFIAGIQLQIAQQFKGTGHFSLEGHQKDFGSLKQKIISAPDHLDRFKTPRQLGLQPGTRIFVEGAEIIEMSKSMVVDENYEKTLSSKKLFPRCQNKCRATFIHELYTKTGDRQTLARKHLKLHAIRPLAITVETGVSRKERFSEREEGRSILQHYSPFLDVVDFKAQVHEHNRAARYIYFNGVTHDTSPIHYDPIGNYQLDGGVISFSPAYMSAGPTEQIPSDNIPPEKVTTRTWEMGLAAGGGIHQEIYEDFNPQIWNWKKSVFVNVQLLNTVIFEGVTGLKAPACPISARDYIQGRMPFYHIIQSSPIEGNAVLRGIRSVGQMDSAIDIPIEVSMRKDSGPSGCAICEKNLCDSILQPCRHIFCYECVQKYAMSKKPATCPACLQNVSEILEFSAPMEFPISRVEMKDEIEEKKGIDNAAESKSSKPSGTLVDLDALNTLAKSLKLDPSSSDYSKLFETVQGIQSGRSSLLQAAQKGQVEEVKKLIRDGQPVNAPAIDKDSRTALQAAAENGHLAILRLLLDAGASANEDPAPENGFTALQAACSAGHAEVVKFLITAGSTINAPPCSINGLTALQAAASAGWLEVVRILVDNRADIGAQCCQVPKKILEHDKCPGLTALHFAAENGHHKVLQYFLEVIHERDLTINLDYGLLLAANRGHDDVVRTLLGAGANTQFKDAEGTTSLHEAAKNGHQCTADLLLAHGADINAQQKDQETALYLAAKFNREDMARFLLSKFDSFEPWSNSQKDIPSYWPQKKQFEPALHLCAKNGNEEGVHLLLQLGFDPNGNTKGISETPIYLAAENGHNKIIDMLLDNGAEIIATESVRKGHSITPLHLAAEGGHLETVKLLLSKGHSHKTPYDIGYEALHVAALKGDEAIVQLLIDAGADPKAPSTWHGTPLHQAALGGSEPIVRLLLGYGADPFACGDLEKTPLAMAVGHPKIMRIFLDLGAKPDTSDRMDETPLHSAVKQGSLESFKLLLEYGANPNVHDRLERSMFHCLVKEDYRSFSETDEVVQRPVDDVEQRKSIASILLERGVDLNQGTRYYGETPLGQAIKTRDIEMTRVFLDLGAKIDSQHTLLCGNCPEIVRLLLERGANPNASIYAGESLLHEAATKGWVEILKILVEYGAAVDGKEKISIHSRSRNRSRDRSRSRSRSQSRIQSRSRSGRSGSERSERLILPHRPRRRCGYDCDSFVPGRSPLHMAAYNGHLVAVATLLDLGSDVDPIDLNIETPLHLAAANKHSRVVWHLLEHGADVGVSGINGTALQIASGKGQPEIVNMLLVKGAEVNGPFRFRLGTALERASLSGSVETVRKLLQHGATVNVRSGRHGSALKAACASGRSDVVELLLDHNADIHARGGIFGTALQAASSKGSYQAVKLLLERGADVNAQCGRYRNALQAALVRLHLVRKGSQKPPDIYDDWDISEKNDSTEKEPIPTALDEDDIQRTVKALLDNGANVNAPGKYATALQIASLKGYKDIVEMIIDRGASLDADQGDLGPSLTTSSNNNHIDVCKVLLRHGADFNLHDKYGHTALHYAARKGNVEIVNALQGAGALCRSCPNCGSTPVHTAAWKGQNECLTALWEGKADLNACDRFGRTPLSCALAKPYRKSIDLLLSYGVRVDIRDFAGRTTLDWAISIGDSDLTTIFQKTASPTPEDLQYRLRVQSLADLGAELRKSSFRDPNLFYHIGHCLLLLGDNSPAGAALRKSVYQNSEIPFFLSCNNCKGNLRYSWYFCKSCPDTDFCYDCFASYNAREPTGHCNNHKFLTIIDHDSAQESDDEAFPPKINDNHSVHYLGPMRPTEQEWDISPEDGDDNDLSRDEISEDERSSVSGTYYLLRPHNAKQIEASSNEEIENLEETFDEATILNSNEIQRDNFGKTNEVVNARDVDEIRENESFRQTEYRSGEFDLTKFLEQHDSGETEEDGNILGIDHILGRHASRRSSDEGDDRDEYIVVREVSDGGSIPVQHRLDYWERWIKNIFSKYGIEES